VTPFSLILCPSLIDSSSSFLPPAGVFSLYPSFYACKAPLLSAMSLTRSGSFRAIKFLSCPLLYGGCRDFGLAVFRVWSRYNLFFSPLVSGHLFFFLVRLFPRRGLPEKRASLPHVTFPPKHVDIFESKFLLSFLLVTLSAKRLFRLHDDRGIVTPRGSLFLLLWSLCLRDVYILRW